MFRLSAWHFILLSCGFYPAIRREIYFLKIFRKKSPHARQQHPRQNRDDRDYHEEFDQGKTPAVGTYWPVGAGGRVRRPPTPLRPAGCRCRVRVGGLAGLGGERYPVGVRDAPRSAAFSPPDPSLSRRRTTLERVQAAEVFSTRSSTEVNRLKPLVFSDLIDVSDSFFVKTFSFICNIKTENVSKYKWKRRKNRKKEVFSIVRENLFYFRLSRIECASGIIVRKSFDFFREIA